MHNISSSSSSAGSVGASPHVAPAPAFQPPAGQPAQAQGALSLPPPPRRPSDPDLLRLQQLEMAAEEEIPPPPADAPESAQSVYRRAGAVIEEAHALCGHARTMSDQEILAALNHCVNLHDAAPGCCAPRVIADICLQAFKLYARQATGMHLVPEWKGDSWSLVHGLTQIRPPVSVDATGVVRAGMMLALAAQCCPGTMLASFAGAFQERCARLTVADVDLSAFTQNEVVRLQNQAHWIVNGNFMAAVRSAVVERFMDDRLAANARLALPSAIIADYLNANGARRQQATPVAELERYATAMQHLLESEFLSLAERRDTDPDADRKFRDRTEATIQALFDYCQAPDNGLTNRARLELLNRCVDLHERSGASGKSRVVAAVCLSAACLYASEATGFTFHASPPSDRFWKVGLDHRCAGDVPVKSDSMVRAGFMFALATQWFDGTLVIPPGVRGQLEGACDHISARGVDLSSFTQAEIARLLGQSTWSFSSAFMTQVRKDAADAFMEEQLARHGQIAPLSATIAYYADETKPVQRTPLAELGRYAREMATLLDTECASLDTRCGTDPQARQKFRDRCVVTLDAYRAIWERRSELQPQELLDVAHAFLAVYDRVNGAVGAEPDTAGEVAARAFALHLMPAKPTATAYLRAGLLMPLLEQRNNFSTDILSRWIELDIPRGEQLKIVTKALTPLELKQLFDDSTVTWMDRGVVDCARKAARPS